MKEKPAETLISFGREKKLLLAWLVLLAPLPLPFNEQILEWPALFLYAFLLIHFIQRVERERDTVLPNWVLNVLGLLYMPILAIDLQASFARGRPVAALLHLIMFLILCKIYAVRREKDKWHLIIAAFFLFVGSMATSTHMSVVIYLVAYMVLMLLVLSRFAHFNVLTKMRQRRPADVGGAIRLHEAPSRQAPLRWPLVVCTVLIVALAIPTFATLPRLREPFIFGPGGGSSLIRTSGFSDSVDLSQTSSIRGNREVVLRMKFSEARPADAPILRLKGATFDRYANNRWHRQLDYANYILPNVENVFRLSAAPTESSVEIFRERINSNGILLPMETARFVFNGARVSEVGLDLGGAVFLARPPPQTIRYTAYLADTPQINARLRSRTSSSSTPEEDEPYAGLDPGGLTDPIRELAREVMGDPSDPVIDRIYRLESYLLRELSYTTVFLNREGDNPLEDFLFVHKSGHCELFASAMVLMLRAEGIPARFIAGFLDAEYNPLEGYYMVRQENAHAWVEAYTEDQGWQVFDPTPPDGRPAAPERSLSLLVQQLYDFLTFRWDRYVLTYGAADQRSFFQDVREWIEKIWGRFSDERQNVEAPEEKPGGFQVDNETEIREPKLWLAQVPVALAVAVFVGALVALLFWHRRRLLTAEAAYMKLRRHLANAGLAISDTLAPLELEEIAAAAYPAAAEPTRRVMALYLRDSFAEKGLSRDERAGLAPALDEVRLAIRRTDRERRRRS